MNTWELVFFGVVSIVVSILTGITGAGGGFIITPLGIFLGLTPAQMVSSGKFSGLSITVGALLGMKNVHGTVSKKRVLPVMGLALVVGLAVPHVIKTMHSDVYQQVLGIILLLMIPIMIVKKVGVQARTPKPWQKVAGGILLTLSLILQGIFSGGLGTLVNIVLMGMLGMTALEANLTKRWSQLILNAVIILGVLTSGLIVWPVVLVSVVTTFAGGYIGGKLATKKDDKFIADVMIGLMFFSAIALIIGV